MVQCSPWKDMDASVIPSGVIHTHHLTQNYYTMTHNNYNNVPLHIASIVNLLTVIQYTHILFYTYNRRTQHYITL